MKKLLTVIIIIASLFATETLFAQTGEQQNKHEETKLSLITETPEEGFQVAIKLARKGVTETQSDREVLFALREAYANDPDALIASSQVIAIHFKTVAAANNYWREIE